MVFLPQDRPDQGAVAAFVRSRLLPNSYDIVAFALVIATIALVLRGSHEMRASLEALSMAPVSLDIGHLPEYALRTTLRMFAAIIASLVFTFVVATLAAKSKRAELVIIPALDILQSVPVLGFLTFTVTFFIGLFPGSQLGAECASIFAIFTAQAWNMAFSFYQSLRTVPNDLDEVSRGYGLSTWQRFWKLEAPFAAPGLIWNTMMSMSGGWFFVVASEAITVGNTTVQLPGIGSYLALAIDQKNFTAVAWAVLAMAVLILLYDQLFFRPIVAWADRYRFEQTASAEQPGSWAYDLFRRTRLLPVLLSPILGMGRVLMMLDRRSTGAVAARSAVPSALGEALWRGTLALLLLAAAWLIVDYVGRHLSGSARMHARKAISSATHCACLRSAAAKQR